MSWRNLMHLVLVVLVLAVALPLTMDQGRAQSKKAAISGETLQSMPQEPHKSAHERRKEARKRLQEALEVRKAGLVAARQAPVAKGGKGVQNE